MRGHWKLLYYFSPKLSARLGGEVKSLTGGHYAAERISLRQTSTVIHYCVIQKYIRKECLQCLRESIKDNQVAQRNHRYLGDKNHVSKEKICIFGTSDRPHMCPSVLPASWKAKLQKSLILHKSCPASLLKCIKLFGLQSAAQSIFPDCYHYLYPIKRHVILHCVPLFQINSTWHLHSSSSHGSLCIWRNRVHCTPHKQVRKDNHWDLQPQSHQPCQILISNNTKALQSMSSGGDTQSQHFCVNHQYSITTLHA